MSSIKTPSEIVDFVSNDLNKTIDIPNVMELPMILNKSTFRYPNEKIKELLDTTRVKKIKLITGNDRIYAARLERYEKAVVIGQRAEELAKVPNLTKIKDAPLDNVATAMLELKSRQLEYYVCKYVGFDQVENEITYELWDINELELL